MQYEPIPVLTKKEIREILFSSSVGSDEKKSIALFSSIYNQNECFSSEMIIESLRSGIWNDQIRAARIIEPFMQSQMSVAGVESFIDELKHLKEGNINSVAELSEIIETVSELKGIILKSRVNN